MAETLYNILMMPLDRSTHPSTRERILAYLQENRTASVQSLSRAWGLTRADIRYHIHALMEEGTVEQVPRDPGQPARRGRPEQKYHLAARSAPDNLGGLGDALLEELLCRLPVEERDPALRELAERMAKNFISVPNTTQRLNQACVFLSDHGYRARWEAHANGPRILLRNCPYAALLPTHPELCTLDRFLLEHLVQTPMKQTARINLQGDRPAACIFASRLES